MPETCLFCRIAGGELPAHIVHEDAEVMAFLDLHPIRPGHTLVIPKSHHVWFEDMPPPVAARVMGCAQMIATRLKRLYGVERVGMAFTGIHVPHAHAHLVPMHEMHDLTSSVYLAAGPGVFSTPPRLPETEMADIATALREA